MTKMLHFGCVLFSKLFLTTLPNFIRIRYVRAELECRKVRMLVCNYFAYFYCAFSCNCALLLLSAAAFRFPAAANFLSLLIFVLLFFLFAQTFAACIWLLTFNCQLLIRLRSAVNRLCIFDCQLLIAL